VVAVVSDKRCIVCGLPVVECLRGITKFLLAQQRSHGWQTPPDNCIPESAQRILDLGRTQQPPQPVVHKPQQAAASDGIGRAVDRLSQHEPRLGAARWQAEA
jgi:hypothetical protein